LLSLATKRSSDSNNFTPTIQAGVNNPETQGFTQGNRDDGIFKIASQCRAHDMDITLAYERVEQVAMACTPPFDLAEARKKVDWCYSRYPAGFNF
jgi:hypothetical protein